MSSIAAIGLPQRKYNVELVKKNRAHFYDVKDLAGKQLAFLPGVTGTLGIISKPALIPWATKQALLMVEGALTEKLAGKDKASVELTPEWIAGIIKEAKERPDKLKTDAADIGTLAHAAFDDIVHGKEVKVAELHESIRVPVQNFLDWLKTSGIQLIMGDTKVASVKEGFGGSLDALGWKDGKYIMLDWKTNKSGIYQEAALQTAAYCVAFEETYGVPVNEAHVVRLDKSTKAFQHKRVTNTTVAYAAFAAAKELKSILEEGLFDE